MYPSVPRPKQELLFKNGHRHLLNSLVQLGNDILSRKLKPEDIALIQIYRQATVWFYAVYKEPSDE